ncbi:MAG TPA: ABC transporter permease [Pseudonocardiaceae bacterium]|jgi:ABC-type transport system involved in multi-copper enzyme maturation permease subunit|nr:ABC transporter permease [Pseudonocardiaceae bacterium]
MTTDTMTGPPRQAQPDALPPGLKVTQWGVLRSEWLKFWSLRSSQISVVLAVIATIGLDCLFAWAAVSNYERLKARGAKLSDFFAADTALHAYFLVQLVVGVLGVLVVTGEYGTGMIRSSLAAAPKRLPVVWGKVIVFAVIVFVVTTISTFIGFLAAQPILNSDSLGVSLSYPGAVRAIIGIGFYLTVIGLIGSALGWLIRHTAGALAALFGLILIAPGLGELLPTTWQPHILPYLPSNAGGQIASIQPDPTGLALWPAVLTVCVWLVVLFAGGILVLKRRDA